MTITNYNILRHPVLEALENAVRHSIQNGWQPFGNRIVEKTMVNNQTTFSHVQAMVRYS